MDKYRKIYLFALEIGKGLCENGLLDEILKTVACVREKVFRQYGVVIPAVNVRENKGLKPLEYVIKVSDIPTSRYELKENSVLIIENKKVKSRMRGKSTREPAFNMPALWIPAERKSVAEERGYVAALPRIIIRNHLFEIVRENLSRVITTQYVKELMDEVAVENEALCSQIARKLEKNTLAVVKNVLIYLLEEGIGITDIITILEEIADDGEVEDIRLALAPRAVAPLLKDGKLRVVFLGRNFTSYLYESSKSIFNHSPDGEVLAAFKEELSSVIRKSKSMPVVICRSELHREAEVYIKYLCGFKDLRLLTDEELKYALDRLNFCLDVGKTPSVGDLSVCGVELDCVGEVKPHEKYPSGPYRQLQSQLMSILDKMQPKEREVLAMRFGLNGNSSHSLEEVGLSFDISRERIRQIEAKALLLIKRSS